MNGTHHIMATENLSIGYPKKGGGKIVASDINITLEKGKVTALIGANGAGKSTLLKTLTGILPAIKGHIKLDEMPLYNYSPQELAQQLSVVLTEKLPPGNLTVYELVALGRQPYTNWLGKLTQADKDQVEIALSLTQTARLTHRKYYEISDGQLQKVLIARALAQDTPLVILDEPTTHLDLLHKVNVLQLLKKLAHEQDKCILYSTHDLDLALEICDSLIILSQGIAQQGTPNELIEKNAFSALFEGENIQFDPLTRRFIFKST
ncbi:ABC transporter ATP-binding protein [Flavobacterium rhizosphaerae]|uniref:ABC transporter ATP-binding protein n=1 Tax=Flavobacterium rhizosphaerae TaxID=3163298 RepID=A0ABW8YWD5_9FLAO